MEMEKKQELRYGENPHQSAAFYVERGVTEPCVSTAEQMGGPALSFNNILDTNAALEIVKDFREPAAAVIKHTNPCGAGVADSIGEAYVKAYLGDPVSAFGCIVALNRPFDARVAEAVAKRRAEIDGKATPYFIEVIIAPDFDEDALELLSGKVSWAERTRLLKTGELDPAAVDASAQDMRRVVGGMLVQGRDLLALDESALKTVTDKAPTARQMADLRFAWTCCKHVKSNAIVLARDGMLVGTGAGQMSRVDAAIVAVRKAGERADGSVLASDAFFPFPDAVEVAARAGVKAIIQPGGAKGDREVIEVANRLGVAMVLTGARHFRH
jgi:phosphoribosylaminoimidazolecarboxamide formyltransferase/IMP cyclohydrolase